LPTGSEIQNGIERGGRSKSKCIIGCIFKKKEGGEGIETKVSAVGVISRNLEAKRKKSPERVDTHSLSSKKGKKGLKRNTS